MTPRADSFDLGALRLTAGEGRRLELAVALAALTLSGERYSVSPTPVPVRLDVSRTTGSGYALRLRFAASLHGPCMRCLEAAEPGFEIDVYEVSQPGEEASDELDTPYLQGGILDLASWARDALALRAGATLLCRPDCAGLCPVCGARRSAAGADHDHERAPDPRWAKLAELHFGAPAGD